ncbi:hypothetical protein [Paractinoplanes durhamensis]|uniref:hypothetical protein n=1 Tax=Paractinoplanes durhamensis TaxID=113563 RepID=UPI00362E4CAE
MRRRRLIRRVTAAAAVLIAAGAVTTVHDRSQQPPPVVAPAIGEVLDGYRITWLPDGTVRTGPDSAFHEEGAKPVFQLRSRRFDRGTGRSLWISVMRPGSNATTAQVRAWAVTDAKPVNTFPAPAGNAELLAHAGTETTTYLAVITTPDGVVITVEATGWFTAAEVESVARGIDG